jgi:16S rRNA (guanine1207-N2)-methyltransferase
MTNFDKNSRYSVAETFSSTDPQLPPLLSESLLIESLGSQDYQRALVVSPGRAQAAEHLQRQRPGAEVVCWYLDLHNAQLAKTRFQQISDCQDIEVVCAADLPEREFQLVAMPVLKRSEGELTRDLMQQACLRLAEGGVLWMSVDNPNDHWLHNQLKELFRSVHAQRSKSGVVYQARKRGALKRVRNFKCQFAFRDQGQLIQVISEPGVFSHRRLDPGSRQLLNVCGIEEEDRVLDLGCGSGGIALAASFWTGHEVLGVDCNARAIRCLQAGAELNHRSNVAGYLDASGDLGDEREFEVVLANPPYFGNNHISQLFVDTAERYLVSGGALLLVTKQPAWYQEYMQDKFEDIESFPSGYYHVVCGRKA